MKTHMIVTGLTLAGGLALGGPALAKQQATGAGQDRPVATQMDDGWITTKVKSQFVGVDVLAGSDIDVDTSRGVVTLTGHVASEAAKARALALAREVDGVKRVNDKLTIGANRSDTGERVGEADTDTGARAKDAGREAGSTINDGWITTKLKAKFVPEDVLDGSDIKVDTTNGIVTLSGRVPTQAAKARAREIARASDGVRQVIDKMTIGAAGTDTGQAATDRASDATDRAGRTTERAGDAVGDGWITAKVKSQFIGVDVLAGSDIEVDTKAGVVTLTGRVKTQAAKARAEGIAKSIDGVTRVDNRLTIGPA